PDGKAFHSQEECLDHEIRIMVSEAAGNRFDEIINSEEACEPETILDALTATLKELLTTLPAKVLKHIQTTTKVKGKRKTPTDSAAPKQRRKRQSTDESQDDALA